MRQMFTFAMLALSAGLSGPAAAVRQQNAPHHEFDVSAKRYEFLPPRLEVHAGDLVRVTLHSQDISHSFVVDAYRIAKRAAGGGSVIFEFLADRPGEFPFYCNLRNEEGCRNMRGTLVVAGGEKTAVASAR